MIFARLNGGLGNQMFQYAAARMLAKRHNSILKLDDSLLRTRRKGTTPRRNELSPFNINASVSGFAELLRFLSCGSNLKSIINLCLLKLNKVPLGGRYYREPHFRFDPAFFESPDDVCLEGYWQSDRYFREIADLIRNELTPVNPLDGRNLETARAIGECNSVSLHVRRGDYVTDPVIRERHGSLGLDYYLDAAAYMGRATGSPCFFVFSDDPEWVGKNLKIPFQTVFIDHNKPEKAYEDMRLMALCRHNIIANSTFSWWGAWLNRNPGKIVIAPKRWFAGGEGNIDDLLPESWVRI